MTTERRLAERFAETLTAHDLDDFATLLDAGYINHNRYAEPGKAGSVAIFQAFFDAFDGFRVEIDDIIEAPGSVVGRYTYRGRHTGPPRQRSAQTTQEEISSTSSHVKHFIKTLTGCPLTMFGNTDASTTLKFGIPCTRRYGSSTPPSSLGAMRAVLVGW